MLKENFKQYAYMYMSPIRIIHQSLETDKFYSNVKNFLTFFGSFFEFSNKIN